MGKLARIRSLNFAVLLISKNLEINRFSKLLCNLLQGLLNDSLDFITKLSKYNHRLQYCAVSKDVFRVSDS